MTSIIIGRIRRSLILWAIFPSIILGWAFLSPPSAFATRKNITRDVDINNSSSQEEEESNCIQSTINETVAPIHAALFLPPLFVRCCPDDCSQNVSVTGADKNNILWNPRIDIHQVVFSLTALAAELVRRGNRVSVIGTYYYLDPNNISSSLKEEALLVHFLQYAISSPTNDKNVNSDLLEIKLAPLHPEEKNESSSCRSANYNSFLLSSSSLISSETICITPSVYKAMKEAMNKNIKGNNDNHVTPIDAIITTHELLGGLLLAEQLSIPTVVLASSLNSLSLLMAEYEHDSSTSLSQLQRTAPGTGLRMPIQSWEKIQNFFLQRYWNFRLSLSYVHVNKIRHRLGLTLWKTLPSYFSYASAVIVDTAAILGIRKSSGDPAGRSTTYVTGPWLHKYSPNSNNEFRNAMSSTVGDESSPVIIVSDFLEHAVYLTPNIIRSVVRGIVFAKAAIQSYADKVCHAIGVDVDVSADAETANQLFQECKTLQEISNFGVIWTSHNKNPGQRKENNCIYCDDDDITTRLPPILPSFFHVISCIQTPEQIFHYFYDEKQQHQKEINVKNGSETTKTPPVLAVLSTCSSRTVHASLQYGIPSLCLPTNSEELDVAACVLDRDCGLVFSPGNKRFAASSHSDHIRDLLVKLLIGKSAARCYSIDAFVELQKLTERRSSSNTHNFETTLYNNAHRVANKHHSYDDGIFIDEMYRRNAQRMSKQPIFDKGLSQAIQIIQSVVAISKETNVSKNDGTNGDKMFLQQQKNTNEPRRRFSSATWLYNIKKEKRNRSSLSLRQQQQRGWNLYLMGIATFILSCSFFLLLCCII